MSEIFGVALCERGQAAARLSHLLGQPLVMQATKTLSEPAASVGGHDAIMAAIHSLFSQGREEAVLHDLVPRLRRGQNVEQRLHDLISDERRLASQIASAEALGFMRIRLGSIESAEQAFRMWLLVEYDGFAVFAAMNEPVWRAAAAEAAMARIEAERSRREQAELQQALDSWRTMLRDQRSSVWESCSRQKKEWFQQSEDWFVCVAMEEKDQRGLALRCEQQRKSDEWAKTYGGHSTQQPGQAQGRPQSASAGYYQPNSSSSSTGYYQPNAGTSSATGGGYYQPRPAGNVYAATSTGANFGIARPTQPAAVPNAKTGFQATPGNQFAPPPSLFGGSSGYR